MVQSTTLHPLLFIQFHFFKNFQSASTCLFSLWSIYAFCIHAYLNSPHPLTPTEQTQVNSFEKLCQPIRRRAISKKIQILRSTPPFQIAPLCTPLYSIVLSHMANGHEEERVLRWPRNIWGLHPHFKSKCNFLYL